jgi:hypothetical protein
VDYRGDYGELEWVGKSERGEQESRRAQGDIFGRLDRIGLG